MLFVGGVDTHRYRLLAMTTAYNLFRKGEFLGGMGQTATQEAQRRSGRGAEEGKRRYCRENYRGKWDRSGHKY